MYIFAQIDVTAAVLAKREVQKAHADLAEEKIRAEALVHRQFELIECLGWVSELGRSSAGDQRASTLIDKVRRQMVADHGGASLSMDSEKIEITEMLGHGSVSPSLMISKDNFYVKLRLMGFHLAVWEGISRPMEREGKFQSLTIEVWDLLSRTLLIQ